MHAAIEMSGVSGTHGTRNGRGRVGSMRRKKDHAGGHEHEREQRSDIRQIHNFGDVRKRGEERDERRR